MQTMFCSPIRGLESMLNSQPCENFAFQGGPTSPYTICSLKPLRAVAQHLVSRLCQVLSCGRAWPTERVLALSSLMIVQTAVRMNRHWAKPACPSPTPTSLIQLWLVNASLTVRMFFLRVLTELNTKGVKSTTALPPIHLYVQKKGQRPITHRYQHQTV
jgi:hypothetical protein